MQKFYDDMKKREKIYQFKDLDLAMESLDNLCVNFDRMHQSVDRFKNVMIGRKRVAVENFSGNEVAMESHGELIGALIGIVVIISAVIAKVLYHLLYGNKKTESSSPSIQRTKFNFDFEGIFKQPNFGVNDKDYGDITEGEAEKKARQLYYDSKKEDQRLISYYHVVNYMDNGKVDFSRADKLVKRISDVSSVWFDSNAITSDIKSIVSQIESHIDKNDGNINANLIQPIQDRVLAIDNILKEGKHDEIKAYLQDFADYSREEVREEQVHEIKKYHDKISAKNYSKTCRDIALTTLSLFLKKEQAESIVKSLEEGGKLMKTLESKLSELKSLENDFARYEQSRVFITEMRNYLFKVKDVVLLQAMVVRTHAVIYRSAAHVISDLSSLIIDIYKNNKNATELIDEAKKMKKQMIEISNSI